MRLPVVLYGRRAAPVGDADVHCGGCGQHRARRHPGMGLGDGRGRSRHRHRRWLHGRWPVPGVLLLLTLQQRFSAYHTHTHPMALCGQGLQQRTVGICEQHLDEHRHHVLQPAADALPRRGWRIGLRRGDVHSLHDEQVVVE